MCVCVCVCGRGVVAFPHRGCGVAGFPVNVMGEILTWSF